MDTGKMRLQGHEEKEAEIRSYEQISEETGIKPVVIQEICMLAEKYHVSKVILFGSRARGDYKRTSDIDLAVLDGDIARFSLDVDEETSTLLEYDIVDLGGSVQEALLHSIREEGRLLYEKV